MKLTCIFGNFEIAIRNACNNVFNKLIYFGDYFHFIQSNIRYLNTHNMKSELSNLGIVDDLHELWKSEDRNLFEVIFFYFYFFIFLLLN